MSTLIPILLIALAAALQEDVVCIGTGLTAARGEVSWLPALLACVVGTCAVDLFWFAVGKVFGRWALVRPPLRWLISPERLQAAMAGLSRRGPLLLLVSRFMPGLRTALQFGAGCAGMRALTAGVLLVAASLVYVPILFFLAFLLGQSLAEFWPLYRHYAVPAVLLSGLSLWLLFRLLAMGLCAGPMGQRMKLPVSDHESGDADTALGQGAYSCAGSSNT